MRNVKRGQKGFTLLEIIVVLAVIGALAAILAPVVFRYIDDANKARAQADVNAIAAAINQQYKDTGRWAFYGTGTAQIPYRSAVDATLLSSNSECTGAAAAADCTANNPEADTGATWAVAARTDALANQLIKNTPAYATTGVRAWKGPYLDRIPAVDPWGRNYLVNIAKADPTTEGSTQKWVVVISAGPNGNLETAADTAGTGNPTAGGDDIVARVK